MYLVKVYKGHIKVYPVQLGHSRWMNELGYDLSAVQDDILRFEEQGASVSVLAVDGCDQCFVGCRGMNYVQKLLRL